MPRRTRTPSPFLVTGDGEHECTTVFWDDAQGQVPRGLHVINGLVSQRAWAVYWVIHTMPCAYLLSFSQQLSILGEKMQA